MALKFFIIALSIAAANAGIALTSTSDNTYRSPGNLAQVSTQSKTIDTPYSSSSKTDIRVSNPSVYASPAPIAQYVHAAPAPVYQHYAAAPQPSAYSHPHGSAVYTSAPGPVIAKAQYAAAPHASVIQYAQPAAHIAHQPIYAHPAPAVAYAQPQPAVHIAQQPIYSHPAPAVAYAQPQPAPVSYSHGGHLAPAHQPLLGVAFSPASAVAHLTYSNVNDHVNYAW